MLSAPSTQTSTAPEVKAKETHSQEKFSQEVVGKKFATQLAWLSQLSSISSPGGHLSSAGSPSLLHLLLLKNKNKIKTK